MFPIKLQQASARVSVNFVPPIFDWIAAPPRFFEMVHSALAPEIVSSPANFILKPSTSVGECAAIYRIFGSDAAATLSANSLTVDFPRLASGDEPLVRSIVSRIISAFTDAFSDRTQRSMELLTNGHAAIADGASDTSYFAGFGDTLETETVDFAQAQLVSCPHFILKDLAGEWNSVSVVEPSIVLENGLFLHHTVALSRLDASETVEKRLDKYIAIREECLRILGLEWEDGS